MQVVNATGTMTPQGIKSQMGIKYGIYSGFAQEDSHEFISRFIETLHKQTNRIQTKPVYQQLEYDGLTTADAY